MKKWALPIVAIIIVVFIAIAFIGGDSSNTSTSNEPRKVGEGDTNTTSEANTQTEFNLKDQIEFENRILTVNSVERNYIEKSQYAMKPQEGEEFMLVNVTIENKSDEPISFNTFDFQIQNSSGVRTSYGYAGQVADELNSGNLAVGGKVTGNIPFTVKADEQNLKLVFKPSFWTNKEVLINLN